MPDSIKKLESQLDSFDISVRCEALENLHAMAKAGSIDEFAMFSQALSRSQIQLIIEGGLTALPPFECGSAGTEYKTSDLFKDCYINNDDIKELAGEWLERSI